MSRGTAAAPGAGGRPGLQGLGRRSLRAGCGFAATRVSAGAESRVFAGGSCSSLEGELEPLPSPRLFSVPFCLPHAPHGRPSPRVAG